MPTKIELSYIAGVMDSDGTIGIKRSTYSMRVRGDSVCPIYSERVHIRQVTHEAIDLIAATFGGNIGREDPSAKRGKPLYRWGCSDMKAASFLVALLPYLRIKRQQAENCLSLRKIKDRSKKLRIAKGRGHIGGAPRDPEISKLMEEHYLRAKQLNHAGI